MPDPSASHRATTIAIVERSSGELLCHEILAGDSSPYDRISHRFDRFVSTVLPQMNRGEERYYLLYSRTEGRRPIVSDVGIINKPRQVERAVTGSSEPGFVVTVPYRIDWGEGKVAKKGAFPRPPGVDPSVVIDDGGLDEDAIRAAMKNVGALLRNALSTGFSESSRQALEDGLTDLMRSTGSEGEPSEYWDESKSLEESAVDIYDATILLWLESEAAEHLPKRLRNGHRARMEENPERAEEILLGARMLERELRGPGE